VRKSRKCVVSRGDADRHIFLSGLMVSELSCLFVNFRLSEDSISIAGIE
jgi:hypothetical protein